MTNKFPKSNISIFGEIVIGITNEENKHISPHYISERKTINIEGLKQSRSGVYCLRNKLNGRLYIGMARNLEVRKSRHFRDLLNGNHCSKLLQDDFDNHFISNGHGKTDMNELFEFEVIIYCRPSELTFYEHLLIKHLNPYYNIHKEKEITFGCDPDKEPSVGFSHIYNKETGLIDCIDNKGNKVAEYGFDE